jgi:hypothetical protein
VGKVGILGMEHLTFGVRRLAAALRHANRGRPQSGSKLPHSKMAVLILSFSCKDGTLTRKNVEEPQTFMQQTFCLKQRWKRELA